MAHSSGVPNRPAPAVTHCTTTLASTSAGEPAVLAPARRTFHAAGQRAAGVCAVQRAAGVARSELSIAVARLVNAAAR